MSYEITGKLVAKYDTVQRTETFKTREFAIEMSEENNGKTYLSYAKFQCVQDKTGIIENVAIGAGVKVFFNIKGSKWEKDGKTNYITNLDAWRVEAAGSQAAGPVPKSQQGFEPVELPETGDLPF
jgi:hypothetical protein